jgi:hypothetical protein
MPTQPAIQLSPATRYNARRDIVNGVARHAPATTPQPPGSPRPPDPQGEGEGG